MTCIKLSEICSYDQKRYLCPLVSRQSLPKVKLMYDAANCLTTMQDGPTRVTYTYDANGNMTHEQRGAVTAQCEYDLENRILVRQEGVDRVTMTYDGSGLRRSRHMNGVRTTYIWDGSDYLGEMS